MTHSHYVKLSKNSKDYGEPDITYQLAGSAEQRPLGIPMGDACSARTSTAFKPPRFQESAMELKDFISDFRKILSSSPQTTSDFRNPAPLMQNYMIKSVKMTKKSILRDQFSWKVRTFAQNLCENGLHLGKERALCTRFAPSLSHAFRKGCRSFCCSISLPNLHLERDFYEQNQYYIEAVPYGADFNHSSIGAVQGPVESMGRGLRFLYAFELVLSPQNLDERINNKYKIQ